MSDTKLLDEQWALEAALSMVLGALSRATLLHDVGYLESGLQSSLEAIVLGDELVGYARAVLRQVPVDDDSAGARRDRGRRARRQPPRRRSTRAGTTGDFWHAALLDQTVHDRWLADGATTLARARARALARPARRRPSVRSDTADQARGSTALLAEALADRGHA